MATVQFEISDGLTFTRWRQRAGYVDGGRFVVTDEPGERTGEFGKWHVATGDGWTAYPHNGQAVPVQAESSTEVPPYRWLCTQCLAKVLVGP